MIEIPKFFKNTISDIKKNNFKIVLNIVNHPKSKLFDSYSRGENEINKNSNPWLINDNYHAMSCWVIPAGLEKDLVDNEMGYFCSYLHVDSGKYDKVFCELLGPYGLQVSGRGYNPCAFSRDHFPVELDIITYDLRTCNIPSVGSLRPSYWAEPLPMKKFNWTDESSPDQSPCFQDVSLELLNQLRHNVLDALNIECGFNIKELEKFLGVIFPISKNVISIFNRQDHPMFGASSLNSDRHAEALNEINKMICLYNKNEIEKEINKEKLNASKKHKIL